MHRLVLEVRLQQRDNGRGRVLSRTLGMRRNGEEASRRELLQLVHDVLLVADRFRSDQRIDGGQQMAESCVMADVI